MEDKIRLLYAEDDDSWALSIQEMLNSKGFQVKIASNGDAAWEMFQNNLPDMVLLNIDISGRNGWDLIRMFKKEKEWIPVVLYSAYYDSKKLAEAFRVGAEDFISKACFFEELADRLYAFYARSVRCREASEVFEISEMIIFSAMSGVLTVGNEKEILKLNESKLLRMLCLKMGQEADKKYLCEGIWGGGMYNDLKCNALKIYITNLRRFLSGDPTVKIINKRWGGYCLVSKSNSYNRLITDF